MQKEFVQLVFRSEDIDDLSSFGEMATKVGLPSSVRIEYGEFFVRLLSSDFETLSTLYTNFKDDDQVTLEPMLFVAATEQMAHSGLAVELGDVQTGFDLWLEVSPSEQVDNEIEHVYPVTYDTKLLEQEIRKLLRYTPGVDESVAYTKVKILMFTQHGEPSRASLTEALRGAFEGAINKSSPKTLEARVTVELAVVDRQFEPAKELITTVGGEVTDVNVGAVLKKVTGVIPSSSLVKYHERFENISKEGDFGFKLLDFVKIS